MESLGSLGEDLVLLAIRPDGHLRVWDRLRFALGGSELVRLVATGCIELEDGLIVINDTKSVGHDDALLAAALADIRRSKRPPLAGAWVAGRPQRLVDAYLDKLDAAGYVRTERRRMLGMKLSTRWHVADTARWDEAKSRLDAIALKPGFALESGFELGLEREPGIDLGLALDLNPEPDDVSRKCEGAPLDAGSSSPAGTHSGTDNDDADSALTALAALGGLVNAIGLDKELYPGPEGEAARNRLLAAGRLDGEPGMAAQTAGNAVLRAAREATDIALHIAIDVALDAANHATLDMAAHHAAHTGTIGGHH